MSIEIPLPRSVQVQGGFCWRQVLLTVQSLRDTSVMITIFIAEVMLKIRTWKAGIRSYKHEMLNI